MEATSRQTSELRPSLPAGIADALRRVDTARLYDELKDESILSPEELVLFQKTCESFLNDIWFTRDSAAFGALFSSVKPAAGDSAWWKLENQVITPLLDGLREAGLGNDAVLFEQKGVVLTPARLNSHTTDRITLKRHDVAEKKPFFRKPYRQHTFELDVDYPEKGRWGEYETVKVECASDDEADRFSQALEVAKMVGNLNSFLGIARRRI